MPGLSKALSLLATSDRSCFECLDVPFFSAWSFLLLLLECAFLLLDRSFFILHCFFPFTLCLFCSNCSFLFS